MKPVRTTALLAILAALFAGAGFLLAGPRGAILALIVAAAINFATFWAADRAVLRLHKARAVGPRQCPELHGLVAALARRARLPMPRLYIIDSPHPNAFATGRDPHHAAIALTTGLLGLLTRDEIEGVVAHELGHIRAHDTRLMTAVATLAGAISMLASFGSVGRRSHPLALLLSVIVAPLAAMLIQLAISRSREYQADAAGALISGKPHALASALAKLAAGAQATPDPVTRRVPAMAQLYIASPLKGTASLFATHPDPADRIAALHTIAVPAKRPSALDPFA
ncbi:M48 family metalloprotease [Sphingomonas sp. 1P06PA]|uniref:M48 family metalloprotease n=1 Tax=Sphingomonas sp. 1P06PA TaxID=554121 RepID=UPI0039A433CE